MPPTEVFIFEIWKPYDSYMKVFVMLSSGINKEQNKDEIVKHSGTFVVAFAADNSLDVEDLILWNPSLLNIKPRS